jgi:hypothetical protein
MARGAGCIRCSELPAASGLPGALVISALRVSSLLDAGGVRVSAPATQ